ncbi:MAG: NADH-quinone oxidoreductase subunit L [Ktedonobacteraceae bacterium]
MTNLSAWVLLMPLLGFIILGLTGKAMSRRIILTVAWGACGLAFLFATISFFSMLGTPAAARTSDQVLYSWVTSGDFQLSFGLFLDPLSATMLMVVTGVGLLIHIYSAGYMEDDPGFWRYFSFLNFFIFAMVLLVSADNFLFLLVGWGLVGLASFLLIGFWYQRRSAVAAAQKALVINVIGDFGLMIAIFLIFKQYGVLNYMHNASSLTGVFESLDPATAGHGIQTLIALCLFLACAAKSAQLPLYMWLPDAMEGPTPVSALIHAATMVTAGVYLVARAHPLFELSPTALEVVAVIGGITALFAATIALFQLDIKRVLAYSTISQLGYMFMAEGAHNYSSGMFHLTTHAYFKALLFLAAGVVIHILDGEQDMRKMGGLRSKLPITFWTFVIAALAISGIPPLSGFWSKDEILSSLLAQATGGGGRVFYLLWGIGIVTAGLTAFYMFRLVFGIFAGTYRGTGQAAHPQDEDDENVVTPLVGVRGGVQSHHGGRLSIQEGPHIRVMTVPLIILAVLSGIGGLVGSFGLFGVSKWHPFSNFLAPVFSDVNVQRLHEASLSIQWISTGLSVVVGLLGILLAWRLYGRGFSYQENKNPLYQLVLHKYYVDELLDALIVQPILWFGRTANRLLEGDVLDGGSRGVAWLLRGTSAGLRRLQTGYMRNYALAILLGVVLIILYYAVRG